MQDKENFKNYSKIVTWDSSIKSKPIGNKPPDPKTLVPQKKESK